MTCIGGRHMEMVVHAKTSPGRLLMEDSNSCYGPVVWTCFASLLAVLHVSNNAKFSSAVRRAGDLDHAGSVSCGIETRSHKYKGESRWMGPIRASSASTSCPSPFYTTIDHYNIWKQQCQAPAPRNHSPSSLHLHLHPPNPIYPRSHVPN
jgi:hypothetical protein